MNEMLIKAIEFANTVHACQMRNNGTPYIVHPVAVVALLGQWGVKDQDVLIAAVLHDTVEDAGITVKTIENVFSAKVATLVDHLTHRDTVPKTEYIASFAAPNIPIEALLIKLADRICNVRDFTVDDPGYVSKYVQKGRPIFEAFLLRRKEIEDQFGPEVAKKAFFSWGQMLAGVQNSTLQQV